MGGHPEFHMGPPEAVFLVRADNCEWDTLKHCVPLCFQKVPGRHLEKGRVSLRRTVGGAGGLSHDLSISGIPPVHPSLGSHTLFPFLSLFFPINGIL